MSKKGNLRCILGGIAFPGKEGGISRSYSECEYLIFIFIIYNLQHSRKLSININLFNDYYLCN